MNWVSRSGILGQSWPKLPFLGKIEIGKNRKILEKKIEQRQYQQISVFRMKFLAKFHLQKMIFDEIIGHLLILPYHRAQIFTEYV